MIRESQNFWKKTKSCVHTEMDVVRMRVDGRKKTENEREDEMNERKKRARVVVIMMEIQIARESLSLSRDHGERMQSADRSVDIMRICHNRIFFQSLSTTQTLPPETSNGCNLRWTLQ